MHSLSQALEVLSCRYDGPTEEKQGYTYIPWNESARKLNEIFGPMGWSSELREVKDDGTGYSAIVRISATVIGEDGGQITITRDGVGYADILTTRDGRLLRDTAIKAAASDAFSRACKMLGDALGLFLYDRAEKEQPKQNYQSNTRQTPPPSRQAPKSSGLSEKMIGVLEKRGVPGSIINELDFATGKQLVGCFLEKKMDLDDALMACGLGNNDGFPY